MNCADILQSLRSASAQQGRYSVIAHARLYVNARHTEPAGNPSQIRFCFYLLGAEIQAQIERRVRYCSHAEGRHAHTEREGRSYLKTHTHSITHTHTHTLTHTLCVSVCVCVCV
ncbi:hypothetical protein GOODEAATRI_034409 [Goodea atripinnis]|uniref:Uncharacterized protein n=1 Tax=Goodea atripinnis TaxID=208336 RepID=A0ABV0NQG6_9TELE